MIGVIADDLSGAAEIGGIGWQRGLRTEIVTTAAPCKDIDLVCLDTDSRLCTAEEAARRVAEAFQRLRDSGVTQFYKKVDSVLRGNIVAEIESILAVSEMTSSLLAPANPSRGRTVRDSEYWINGIAIHQTEFANDPAHPRNSANVFDLLKPLGRLPVEVVKVNGPVQKNGITICEVSTATDVTHWAGLVDSKILPAGGADFFRAWLDGAGANFSQRQPSQTSSQENRKELFICGSTSESSKSFIHTMRERGVSVFSLPQELLKGSALADSRARRLADDIISACSLQRRVILSIGLPLVKDAQIAERLTDDLIKVASMVLAQKLVGHVYCEGGATAAALMNRMDWNRLELIGEICPGVATVSPSGTDLHFTMKPGTYDWPDSVMHIPA